MKKMTSGVMCGTQTLALVTSLFATCAWADLTTATTNITTTEQVKPSLMDQIAEKTQLKLVSYFNGPSLSRPGDSGSPQFQSMSNDFDPTSRGNFDNFVLAGYRIPNSNWIIGAGDELKIFTGSNVPYQHYFEAGNPHAADQGYIASPFLRVANAKLYTKGGFTLGGDIFRAYIPLAYDMQDAGIATILRSDWVASYDVPNSRVSVGAYYSFRTYLNNSSLISNQDTMPANKTTERMVGALFGSYQISDPVAFTVWADVLSARNFRGQSAFNYSNMSFYDEAYDVQPGVSIDITKKFNVNPYINVYTGHITLDAASFGLILAYKAL